MNAFPEELVTHEAPLLIVSGLGSPESHSETPPYPLLENGPRLESPLPCLTDPIAERLAECFRKQDQSGLWAGRPEHGTKGPRPVFRIRTVGRDYRFPPRKANPPSRTDVDASGETVVRTLHSPISPLSPESPLFPDGVFSPLWLRKHQSLLPAVFVAFFNLYTESDDENVQTLEDNKLITTINHQKQHFLASSAGALSATSAIGSDQLRSSGHRTKYAVVILSDESSASIDDRLNVIRRNTTLATNVTFFFLQSPLDGPMADQEQFVSSLLGSLFPGALEYYRELSKHSRKKRSRPVPPPTVPASRALSAQAWTLRYEMKLGVLAEFRQEMDVAGRNYETAYEKLLMEVFEATSSWSERWMEARLLADILTLRMIRCFLWEGDCLAAKQRWSYHITRMKDILNRKGKGTETYGFAGWLSRWNECLAELIQHSDLPVFNIDAPRGPSSLLTPDVVEDLPEIFAEPPPVKPGNKPYTAQDVLHHPGFYYSAAAQWIEKRAAIVKRITPDDGTDMYDPYLCPPPQDEPSMNHTQVAISLLSKANQEYGSRRQKRMADYTTYRIAKLKASQAEDSAEAWADVLRDFRTVIPGYRKEGWWEVLDEVLWEALDAAMLAGDAATTLTTSYELMCGKVFQPKDGWSYDLAECLDDVDVTTKPAVVIRADEVVSFLSTVFTFQTGTVCVGQTVNSQLSITSSAHLSSKPLVFSALKIGFEGGLKTLIIHNNRELEEPEDGTPKESPKPTVNIIDLKGKFEAGRKSLISESHTITSAGYLEAYADLTIAPGETKVYELSTILREAGTAKVLSATWEMFNESFELDFVVMFEDESVPRLVHRLSPEEKRTPNGGQAIWWAQNADGKPIKCPIRAQDPQGLTILPRPPKMEVTVQGLEKGVYINQIVQLDLEVLNGEDDHAEVELEVKILGWEEDADPEISLISEDGTTSTELPYPMGALPPSSKTNLKLSFAAAPNPADCTLQLTLKYHFLSDPETPVSKTVKVDMPIINPFHATFDFSPRVHPDPWPNHFTIPASALDVDNPILGITQRWDLTTKLLNFGEGPLILDSWSINLQDLGSAATCHISTPQSTPTDLLPQTPASLPASFDITKQTPEDRAPSTIDTTLTVTYRRTPTSLPTTTTLPVPRLFVPLREPRVILTSNPSSTLQKTVELVYTLENPTSYFLTFSILMETNSEFAFSGMKMQVLQVLPLSRAEVKYRLRAYRAGVWVRPMLKVVDRYFNKTLKVTPGGEGVGVEKGVVGVWVPEVKLKEVEEKVEGVKV